MKKNTASTLILLGAFALTAATAEAAPKEWTIDTAHSTVGFKIRHMMVSYTRGKFAKFSGTVTVDDAAVAKATVKADIELSTVDTGNAKRDKHLRSPDFFDVRKYPKMSFVSTKVVDKGAGKLEVQGKLSLHGKTKPVTLDVELTQPVKNPMSKKLIRGATATAKISRKEFGLTYNSVLESGGVALGDDVFIELEVELAEK